ncbi:MULTISPECIES: helix-turn-helix domain-containing protein [Enterococcus]|nr:helix-turn-helix transcriptional regulator [Enterococcus mundtii]MBO1085369.1 helix-turn-helix transcriptional regulator [Enterococcus mundtii]MDV7745969.1 helix-turn-helix transcriptional regulator [Enterococcus mundtii]PQC27047.1 transcriptional regulator [Enterococcus mundtii]PTO37861.1 XRE family transcriptional regulator [Enterococcus mundtii]PTO41708.1 XRE family transcriptional regulator [Enterococcus mundtii]
MDLSHQIKKYRKQLAFSQEELAEKLYVSRQTISNWENERSYPDIHNLLLLSVLFDVSLDELVKGDVEKMKENVTLTELNKYTKIMLFFMLLTLISVGPSLFLPGNWRLAFPLIFWIASMYGAIKVEGLKKQENIKTYKEIVAFMENKEVAPLRKQRNKVRNRIEKVGIVILFGLICGVIAFLASLPFILLDR